MPGKLWKHEEEQLLRQPWESGVYDLKLLAMKIKRSEGSIYQKLKRMSLRVVVGVPRKNVTTTPVPLSNGLLTHEEALKVLVGALEALRKPGQDKLELQRLRTLVDAIVQDLHANRDVTSNNDESSENGRNHLFSV